MSCSDWRDVVGYEGYYQVSRFGEVCRLRSDGTRKPPLRPATYDTSGHIKVSLSINGVRTDRGVHQIVLGAWIGPCPDGYEGCHNNGDATDNNLSNLRWDTRSNNTLDAITHGTHYRRRTRRSDGLEFDSISEAARFMGCRVSNIHKACNDPNRFCCGYGWSYC